MRILFLNHNVAWSGGTFFRAYHFARCLVKRGHHVTLLSISHKKRFGFDHSISDGVTIVETPDLFWGAARSGWDPWDTACRIAFLSGRRFDLVHAFDSRPAVVLPALAMKRLGVQVVMDWADWWGRGGTIEVREAGRTLRPLVEPVETYFEEAFRTTADATTVISSALGERAVSIGVRRDTIVQIPSGSDVEGVQPKAKAECRSLLGISSATPLVGYLGILTRTDAKLFFDTCEAIRLTDKYCQFVMVGNHRTRIRQIEGLFETGFVSTDQMKLWLGACDVLVLPLKDTLSSRARWPSKFNDYLAVGRPVVATAVGDAAKFFRDDDIGRCVDDTPAALSAATTEMLADPSRLGQQGDNARGVAESRLAWPILTDLLEAHYSRLAVSS